MAPKIVSVVGWTVRRSSPSASGFSSPFSAGLTDADRLLRAGRRAHPAPRPPRTIALSAPLAWLTACGHRHNGRGRKSHALVLSASGGEAHDVGVHRIAFVAFDGFNLLDLAGPLEVLHTATLSAAPDPPSPAARWHAAPPRPAGLRDDVATLDGRPVRSSSGVDRGRRRRAGRPAARSTPWWWSAGWARRPRRRPRAARRPAGRRGPAGRTASVCTGALVLAAAGLLDGYQATTHWSSCDDLAARHPAVDVLPDRIYVHDRDRWTSAGVTAGIDLFLALVEADCGASDRPPGGRVAGGVRPAARAARASSAPSCQAEPAGTPAIGDLQRWLPDHLTDDLTVDDHGPAAPA